MALLRVLAITDEDVSEIGMKSNSCLNMTYGFNYMLLVSSLLVVVTCILKQLKVSKALHDFNDKLM